MGTLANSEDPDEMPHNAAFHQSLHCMQYKIDLQRKKFTTFLELKTCDPSKYILDHPGIIFFSFMENSIDLKRG